MTLFKHSTYVEAALNMRREPLLYAWGDNILLIIIKQVA
jgi:hypothetical protein